MKLKDVLKDIDFTCREDFKEIKDIEIKDLAYSSMEAGENFLFVALGFNRQSRHKIFIFRKKM